MNRASKSAVSSRCRVFQQCYIRRPDSWYVYPSPTSRHRSSSSEVLAALRMVRNAIVQRCSAAGYDFGGVTNQRVPRRLVLLPTLQRLNKIFLSLRVLRCRSPSPHLLQLGVCSLQRLVTHLIRPFFHRIWRCCLLRLLRLGVGLLLRSLLLRSTLDVSYHIGSLSGAVPAGTTPRLMMYPARESVPK